MVVVECDADVFLVRFLGIPRDRISHAGGKGNVVNKVRDFSCAIGLIDEDIEPHAPKDLRNYAIEEQVGMLRLLVRKGGSNRRIVEISTFLESWFLCRATAVGINPSEFRLPTDPKALHHMDHYERRPAFSAFLEQLQARDEEIRELKKWLDAYSKQ